MIPDAEKVVSEFLRAHVAVSAIVGRRVVGKTPDSIATPWVRLIQLDASNAPGSRAEHLIDFLLQLDCYAGGPPPGSDGGQPEAKLLARTVRAAMTDDMPGQQGDVVVTSVRITGDRRMPDTTDFEPARERVILTAIVHMHA